LPMSFFNYHCFPFLNLFLFTFALFLSWQTSGPQCH
jgi:hypothetical protein